MIYLCIIIIQFYVITYYYQAIYYIIVFKIQSLSTEYQLWQVKTAVIVCKIVIVVKLNSFSTY